MTSWLVAMLVASTLLMGLVLLLRAPARRLFGARAAYALWLLPAVRTILPPLPGWRALYVPVAVFRPHDATLGLVDMATATRLMPLAPSPFVASAITPVPILSPVPGLAHWPMVLVTLWLAGAFAVLSIAMVRYALFLRRALAQAVPLATECGVEVLASAAVPGPVATGIFRRRILLPADFLTRYSGEERRLALLHEAAHHDRLDIAANLAALVVRALHWWNPLAIAAYRAFRADQELACDATILADPRNSRAAYGRALLKSTVAGTPVMACAFNSKSQLKQRICTMAIMPSSRPRLIAGAIVVGLTVAGAAVATASGLAPISPVPPIPMVAPVRAPAAPLAPLAPAAPAAPQAPEAPPILRHGNHLSATERDRRARERALALRDADRAADAANRAAMRAGWAAARAQRDAARIDVQARVVASMGAARARLAAQCAARGQPVAASEDFAALAMCGRDLHAMIRASLVRAREAIAATGLSDAERARTLADLDRAIDRETH